MPVTRLVCGRIRLDIEPPFRGEKLPGRTDRAAARPAGCLAVKIAFDLASNSVAGARCISQQERGMRELDPRRAQSPRRRSPPRSGHRASGTPRRTTDRIAAAWNGATSTPSSTSRVSQRSRCPTIRRPASPGARSRSRRLPKQRGFCAKFDDTPPSQTVIPLVRLPEGGAPPHSDAATFRVAGCYLASAPSGSAVDDR
jgi:hypothetical protein